VNGSWPHGDPQTIARTILAEPRFRSAVLPAVGPSWWERLLRWLGELLRHVFRSVPQGSGNVFMIVVVIAALAVLAVGVVMLVRRARPQPRRAGNRVEASALADELDASALRARARAAAAAQRFREAAALLWASALRALDERGRVRFDLARTPSEWRRLVRDPAFDVLARDAVFALFGERAPDAEALARMNAAYDVLLPR
jgi:hypothetical protein